MQVESLFNLFTKFFGVCSRQKSSFYLVLLLLLLLLFAIMRCNLLTLFYVCIKHETSCVRLENFVYTILEGGFFIHLK